MIAGGARRLSANAEGALYMSLAMAAFCANDTLVKLASAELPLFQTVFVRGLFAATLILGLARARGALAFRPSRSDARVLALRVAGELGATLCFLAALFNMPIANATAIIQAAPLAVALAAALALGEPVGRRGWIAIGVGLVGVLLIVRPGLEGFTVWSLAALASCLFIALRDVATRRLSPAAPSLFAVALTAVTVTAVSGLGSLAEGWRPVSGAALATLAAASALLLVGYVYSVKTMRVGEIAVVGPFRYTVLLWAMLFGYLVFGDRPDALTLAGAAVVVVAGLTALRPAARR
jgi:drug/metabolite transporter (DMT)-like permease